MIEKVISGGQIGVDQAGLTAAKNCGIKTGGWIPRGFKTARGPNPKLKELFNLEEHRSDKYPPRTYSNVRDSDGTLILAFDFESSGTKMTINACKQYKKPYFLIDLNDPEYILYVLKWIENNNIKILNVAGNRDKDDHSVFFTCHQYLIELFERAKEF